jgi:hypothetical protein
MELSDEVKAAIPEAVRRLKELLKGDLGAYVGLFQDQNGIAFRRKFN